MQYSDSAPAADPYNEAYNTDPPPPAAAPASDSRDRDLPPARGRSRSRSPVRSSSYRRSPPPRRPAHAPIVSLLSLMNTCLPCAYLAKQAPNPSNVLGVFGLSIRTTERDLDDEFSRYGSVEKVVIVYDQRVSFSLAQSTRCRHLIFPAVGPFAWVRVHYHVYCRRSDKVHQGAERSCTSFIVLP